MRKIETILIVAIAFTFAASTMATAGSKSKGNTGKSHIYMNYGSIKGDTTEQGHEKWIERTNNNSRPASGNAMHGGGGSRH